MSDKKRPPRITINTRSRSDSDESSEAAAPRMSSSLKSPPRTPRFAEATSVNSPIQSRTNHFRAQPQVSDVGFGYMDNKHESVEMPDTDSDEYMPPRSPLRSPLKSALKIPGAAPRDTKAVLSPTFKEEEIKSPTWEQEGTLEKQELSTDKRQAQDLVR